MSVDKSFIHLFSVENVVGDLSEITKPNVAFVSEEFAAMHFKNENPIGKSIEIEALQYVRDLGKYEIRGVVKNTHPKTHFNYEVLLSQNGALQERYKTLPDNKIQWTYNYVKLKNNADPVIVANKILNYFNASSLKESRGPKDYKFSLMPLADIHLKSDFRFELKESSSKINIRLFTVVSFVILLLSMLNFINLTIAKIIKRTKEFGMRKSIGANISQLSSQVLFEVLLICSLSIVLSLALIELIKPVLNRFFEIDFAIYYSEPAVYLSIFGVLTLCLLLSGFFVGFYLFGKTSTIDILAERNNYSGSFILRMLLILQVTIVIILMAGTFLVNKQIDFILNKPLGFEKENVVVLELKDTSKDAAVFARELEKQSQVEAVGFAMQYFGYPTQSLPLTGLGIDVNKQ